ncbi:hypothetical protein FIBSPDRAFT_933010 [Athelia psychrophila]|uniref:Uncharacterized protein n=1 Tax=Athelia psychrophila TaxID=1759441 RepID=A0A166HQ50_9AGAM|nr:hypothetical protein FIBSPDRAFT_933010 [Fibularhizoctonia sp. CBS 109695]
MHYANATAENAYPLTKPANAYSRNENQSSSRLQLRAVSATISRKKPKKCGKAAQKPNSGGKLSKSRVVELLGAMGNTSLTCEWAAWFKFQQDIDNGRECAYYQSVKRQPAGYRNRSTLQFVQKIVRRYFRTKAKVGVSDAEIEKEHAGECMTAVNLNGHYFELVSPLSTPGSDSHYSPQYLPPINKTEVIEGHRVLLAPPVRGCTGGSSQGSWRRLEIPRQGMSADSGVAQAFDGLQSVQQLILIGDYESLGPYTAVALELNWEINLITFERRL